MAGRMQFYILLALVDAAGIILALVYVYRNGSIAYTFGPGVLTIHIGVCGFLRLIISGTGI